MLFRAIFIAVLAAQAGTPNPPAQPARLPSPGLQDPVVGNWRGTLTSAPGTESPIIITIVRKGDGYAGSTNGLNASSESALKRVSVNGTKLSVEAADDSKVGAVSPFSVITWTSYGARVFSGAIASAVRGPTAATCWGTAT